MADTRAYTMDAFLRDLQAVLHNLYDPFSLRQSPLIRAFGLEKRSNPGLALQDLIIQSVQDLRPRSEVPPQSNAWRLFNILTYRFIEQTNQAAVADAIGLSVRQLRREEHDSIQVLAESLWSRNRDPDGGGSLDGLAWRGEGVLVTRPRDAVRWIEIGPAHRAFLDACATGRALTDAAADALDADGSADLARLMADLLDAGAFARLSVARGAAPVAPTTFP